MRSRSYSTSARISMSKTAEHEEDDHDEEETRPAMNVITTGRIEMDLHWMGRGVPREFSRVQVPRSSASPESALLRHPSTFRTAQLQAALDDQPVTPDITNRVQLQPDQEDYRLFRTARNRVVVTSPGSSGSYGTAHSRPDPTDTPDDSLHSHPLSSSTSSLI